MSDHIREITLIGYQVTINDALGCLSVAHDGDLPWDDLFRIKGMIWGVEARAIEVYPSASALVNNRNMRHLWRLGDRDFCPDLLGPVSYDDSLEARYNRAWAEALA